MGVPQPLDCQRMQVKADLVRGPITSMRWASCT